MNYYNRENELVINIKEVTPTEVKGTFINKDGKTIKIMYGIETFRFMVENEVLVELKN